MTTVIRDNDNILVLIKWTIIRTDHHNPLDSQITSTKLKYGMTDLHKRTVCFFSYFNLLQITVHKHKGSDCSAFKTAVKN